MISMAVLFNILLLCMNISKGFLVYDDLYASVKDNFTITGMIEMKEDHTNYQPNQPPWQWKNMTFEIPDYSVALQLTSLYYGEKLPHNDTRHKQEIPYYCVNELHRTVDISITWWSKPWTLYVAWAFV